MFIKLGILFFILLIANGHTMNAEEETADGVPLRAELNLLKGHLMRLSNAVSSFASSVAVKFKTLWENQRTLKKVLISGDTSDFNSTRNYSATTDVPTAATATTSTRNTLCGANEFSCSEGAPNPCIPNASVCDGYNDCGNGRDEASCDHV